MMHALDQIPPHAQAHRVQVQASPQGLLVALDQATRAGRPGVDYVDQPTFLLLPEVMDYARGFIGLVYQVAEDLSTDESIHLRSTDGPAARPCRTTLSAWDS